VFKVCRSRKNKNLKLGGGFKGAITTNRGLVHLSKNRIMVWKDQTRDREGNEI
jgi:hypothetical protein